MAENPFHGLNFCRGTVCGMLENPGEEVCEVIRRFGERRKIFYVHFRNIRGAPVFEVAPAPYIARGT